MAAIEEGRSYHWIARNRGISKKTVAGIMARSRTGP
jgi:DNA-binding CsgD family transcriptional regulator